MNNKKLYGVKPPKPFPGPKKRWFVLWAQPLGLPECPYMYRWVFGCPWFAIRIHHWISSDDDRAFHDHPWWFITLVLAGGYTDVSPAGEDKVRIGSIRFRRALHSHTVRVNPGGCWTLLVTGAEKRYWGFYPEGKFMRNRRYFEKHKHHPCAVNTDEEDPQEPGMFWSLLYGALAILLVWMLVRTCNSFYHHDEIRAAQSALWLLLAYIGMKALNIWKLV